MARSPRFEELLAEVEEGGGDHLLERIRQRFFAAKTEDRVAIVEEFVAETVAKVLRVPSKRIDLDRALDEQGLDSLMAVELFGILENQLGVPISPSQLIENPTIRKASAAIARVLETQTGGEAFSEAGSPPAEEEASPERDVAILTETIDAMREDAAPPPARPPREIFVTGATGFWGPYLVKSLLDACPGARLTCLVRSGRAGGIWKRLEETWPGSISDAVRDRIACVEGDLTQPALGLGETRFRDIADRTDTILHAAAEVSHFASYGELREVNVLGLAEIFRLALSGSERRWLHLLSSVTTIGVGGRGMLPRKAEHTPPDPFDVLANDYGKSKAIAEVLASRANLSVPHANVFRVAHLFSMREPERSCADQGLWIFLRLCCELGMAPSSGGRLQLTDAAYAAEVVARSIAARLPAGTWHVAAPDSPTFDELVERLRECGHDVRSVDAATWGREIEKLLVSSPLGERLSSGIALFQRSIPKDGVLDTSALDEFLASKQIAVWPAPYDMTDSVGALETCGYFRSDS